MARKRRSRSRKQPKKTKCRDMTSRGRRCGRHAVGGSAYCTRHLLLRPWRILAWKKTESIAIAILAGAVVSVPIYLLSKRDTDESSNRLEGNMVEYWEGLPMAHVGRLARSLIAAREAFKEKDHARAIEEYRKVLENPEAEDAVLLLAHTDLGEVFLETGDAVTAEEQLKMALQIAQRLDSKEAQACVYCTMANIPRANGCDEQAIELIRKSLDLLEGTARRELIAVNMMEMGKTYVGMDRWVEAEEWFQRALEEGKGCGVVMVEAHAYTCVATMLLETGKNKEAREALDQALALVRADGERAQEADIMNEYARALQGAGFLDESQQMFAEVRGMYRAEEEWFGASEALTNLGTINREMGRYELSERCLLEALTITKKHEYEHGENAARNALAIVYRETDRPEDAIRMLRETIVTCTAFEQHALAGVAHGNLARVFMDEDLLDSAEVHLKVSYALGMLVQDTLKAAIELRQLAWTRWRMGDGEKARYCLEKSATLSHEIGNSEEEMAAREGIRCLEEGRTLERD